MTNPGDFWAFSLRYYAQPGVSPALLRWQDEAGADVDIVLYILWRAASGQSLDPAALETAEAAVAGWRTQIVQPLRAVRRALDTVRADVDPAAAEVLRARVKADELEAERLQHQALERLALAHAESRQTAGPVNPTAALQIYTRRLAAADSPWPQAEETISFLAAALLNLAPNTSSA